MSRQIWEIFPFFNETMLAEIRMDQTQADHVVVIEAAQTFSGQLKPWNFPPAYRDSCRYIQIPEFPRDLPLGWSREYYQQNYALPLLEIADDDLVVCSDADEIPNWKTVLKYAPALDQDFPAFRLAMTHHKYRFDLIDPGCPWEKAAVCTGRIFKQRNFLGIRDWKDAPVMPDGGWHLYGIGDDSAFLTKARATSHFNDQCTLDMIARIESGSSLIDEERDRLISYPIDQLPPLCREFGSHFFQP